MAWQSKTYISYSTACLFLIGGILKRLFEIIYWLCHYNALLTIRAWRYQKEEEQNRQSKKERQYKCQKKKNNDSDFFYMHQLWLDNSIRSYIYLVLPVSINHIFSAYYRYLETNRIDTLRLGLFDKNELLEVMWVNKLLS